MPHVLPKQKYKLLPDMYALTGCDTTSNPYGKGKVTAFSGVTSSLCFERVLFRSTVQVRKHKFNSELLCIYFIKDYLKNRNGMFFFFFFFVFFCFFYIYIYTCI